MTKLEAALLAVLIAVGAKLAWEMGAKAERQRARIEYITERFASETQIALYTKAIQKAAEAQTPSRGKSPARSGTSQKAKPKLKESTEQPKSEERPKDLPASPTP